MATKKELVEGAYAEIGLAGYVFDLTDDELETALKRCDRLAAQWDSLGIRIGYNLPAPTASSSSLSDDSGLPDWAEDAFITNLALKLAPTVGKNVSIDTRIAARRGYNALLIGNYDIPQMQEPRHMPIGTGNRRNTKTQVFFAPKERITTTHDALLQPDGDGVQEFSD